MQKIHRTISATSIAFILSIAILYFFEETTKYELHFGEYVLLALVYGFPMLLIGIVLFCVINYLTQIRIRRGYLENIHLFYFGLSIAFGCIPVLGFAIFDYSQRGRYFDEPSFADLVIDYSPALLLTVIGALMNWQLVWERFQKG